MLGWIFLSVLVPFRQFSIMAPSWLARVIGSVAVWKHEPQTSVFYRAELDLKVTQRCACACSGWGDITKTYIRLYQSGDIIGSTAWGFNYFVLFSVSWRSLMRFPPPAPSLDQKFWLE